MKFLLPVATLAGSLLLAACTVVNVQAPPPAPGASAMPTGALPAQGPGATPPSTSSAASPAAGKPTLPPSAPSGGSPSGEATAPQAAGSAAGRATDWRGEPLANVHVDLDGRLASDGDFQAYHLETDGEGRYRQDGISPGLYKAGAWTEVDYHGQAYKLPLWSPQGSHADQLDPARGIARDFVLRVSGEKPGAASTDGHGAYYGGTIQVYGGDYLGNPAVPAGTGLRIRLEPEGPLMDGSTGSAIETTVESTASSDVALEHMQDVPLGRYTVTAEALLPEGATALRVATKGGINDADFAEEATLDFAPEVNAHVRPYQERPTKRAAIYLRK